MQLGAHEGFLEEGMPELVPSEELPTKAKVSKSIQAAWAYKGYPSARVGAGTDRRPGAPIHPLWSCRNKGVQPAMLGLWSLLLLWGLVTPCQGLLETVGTLARIDKDELGKAIQNSLVGGPILQNVLGSVTAVNQGLLGSGGLLGGGGLLGHGGVFGVVEELSGLKIEELTLPKESLKLLPGFGVQLNLHTKVGMHCSGPLGGLLQLAAEVNVTSRVALGVSSRGTPILILKRCSTLLGHISLFSGLLPTPLFGVVEQMLFKVLPGLLCPVVDSVLGVVNELLGAVLGLVPLGALGSLEFSLATLPLISNQYIELDINPIVKSVAGDIIDFPKSPAPAKVPPKEDHTSQVTVPLYLFNTMFGLLQTNGALDMDITPELVPSDVPLTTTDLAALLPEALGKLPLHQHLLLSLRVKEAPTVTLNNKKALVSLLANIHVLFYVPQGTPESLFKLNSVMTLRAQLTPSATKLHISLCLERLSVKVASSFTYAFDESRLEEWLSHVVRVVYAPKLNVALDVGIPLPKVLNISFSSSVLEIIENAVVLTVAS
ncbi:BPI fold-containing family B member 3 [Macaca thibetana thibetana]|uniref:BPI fold-containing family B member 3 n=1 Tax=Macaca thibetana thibetana TaxID=257877 RepID=UPI0021BCDCEB|nr:BPI fold-containing family B member 3 [Macaca thibetana thibetana]